MIEIVDGLFYDEETGLPWTSKNGKWGYGKLKRLTGKTNGYYTVSIKGKMKDWHRLVFEHFNGPIPSGMDVDHINNIRDDNRIENLQLLSHKDNSRKRNKHTNNTSGYTGVSWFKRDKKWVSQITINGKVKYLGLFDDPKLAHEAYLTAKKLYHGEDSIKPL